MQDNYQSAENKQDREHKPFPDPVLYRAAIHDVLALQSISPTPFVLWTSTGRWTAKR